MSARHNLSEGLTPRILFLCCLWLLLGVGSAQCSSGTTGYNCVACPDGCDNCDTVSTLCDTCSTGYYIDSLSVCVVCPNHCLKCESASICSTCTPGYETTYNDSGEQEC